MTDLVFYLFVFLTIGVFFLFIHLLIGKFIRPYRPDAEKMTIYECGEPTVGSAWIQFDLRYYVVALLFVVFDVEVAFFFPWAVVFGKANELAKPDSALTAGRDRKSITQELVPAKLNLAYLEAEPTPAQAPAQKKKKDAGDAKKKAKAADDQEPPGRGAVPQGLPMGGPDAMAPPTSAAPPPEVAPIKQEVAQKWAWIAFFDILVFFSVLMVGFAYLWKRGDIDWVRSTAAESEPPPVA